MSKKDIKDAYQVMQRAWVEKNHVSKGTKVRVLRGFEEDEFGSCVNGPPGTDAFLAMAIGNTGTVRWKNDRAVEVCVDGHGTLCPFFVLEVIEMQHTISFDGGEAVKISDESFKALRTGLGVK